MFLLLHSLLLSTNATTMAALPRQSRHLEPQLHKQVQNLSKRSFKRPFSRRVPIVYAPPFSLEWWWYHIRVGLAGGIAGAVGSVSLHPVDSAKTLRQANPEKYASVLIALQTLWSSKSRSMYAGVLPAALGAIPSSALYFGAYESMKSLLLMSQKNRDKDSTFASRLLLHAAAAASGNVLSSAIFVPKEFLKQQLQMGDNGLTVAQIIATHGFRGCYRGYQATLARNIPTAALRFVLYEELKWRWFTKRKADNKGHPWVLFAAGAAAGACASFVMTPLDVAKTRLSTGNCPSSMGSCLIHVVDTSGWRALYAGGGSRIFFSSAFSAVGFGTFESAKRMLGVSSRIVKE